MSRDWGAVRAAIRDSGHCLAIEFLESLDAIKLGSVEPRPSAMYKCVDVFQQMAESGRVSRNHFKPEMDGLWAFKFEIKRLQYRFPCFQDTNNWIITHGFSKPGAQKGLGDWPKQEVKRAKDIRAEYYKRKTQQARKQQ